MKFLVDTHAVVWYLDQPTSLSAVAHLAMTDPANELMFSAGSIWEIAVKVSVGKLALSLPYQAFVARAVTTLNLHILPVTVAYCDAQISLPFHHRDPFDRLIIAQAIVEQIPIASADPAFDAYPVTRLW